ncbi:uroporphyrinogen decarboxylase [Constrictibacter sp. MBR-5]|uniref:uroporphyrinogen decarboxylase n=1 Tax=Constrictibacter sp. MBR-5 TaxID=3156467 RepID=UPI003399319C
MPPAADKPFLRALGGEPAARPPFWLMRQAGRYLPEYRAVRAGTGGFLDLCYTPAKAAEVTLQPIRRYGMDAAIIFSDILVVPHGLGQEVAFREGEGPVLEPVRCAADLERLNVQGVTERLAPVYEAVDRVAGALPGETALIGFAGAPWTVACYMVEGRGSRDFGTVKRWAFTDPDGFDRLIRLLEQATVAHLCAQIAAGAEVVQLFDTWAGVLPERAMRRLCLDPCRRIAAAVRAAHPGVPVIAFPRGVGPAMSAYAACGDFAAVSIDQAISPDWAARHLQPHVAVQGNLDPWELVAGGSALADGIAHIRASLGGGPFVFNLGHGIVPQTPPEHVAMLAALLRGEGNRA